MRFTIPIEIVVDGERVERERAAMESLGADRKDNAKWENPIRVLGLRKANSSTKRVSKKRASRLKLARHRN